MPKPKLAKSKAKTGTTEHKPEEIPPLNIRANPENPRIDFPDDRIESLAESIEDQGVLVPVTVYHDPKPGKTDFVLLDGERRWRAAKLINKPTVPAWVIPKPSGVDNVVRMFNIHMMRDEWGEMATALALKKIMDATGKEKEEDLRKLTGLSKDRITNIKRVLKFPTDWHTKVLDGDIPFNLLVELDKAVLSKKRDPKKQDVINATEEQLRDIFLDKYEHHAFDDVVDLRKVGVLIDTAASQHSSAKVRDRARRALSDLIKKRDASIADAYQFGAAASVEIKNILRDVDHLPERLVDLTASELQEDERERLLTALTRLRTEIDTIIEKLSDA
jgi:ParB family chromosome partitioning protein